MSEMAKYRGKLIKIGTCEDMLYLRFDQRHLVEAVPNSVDPVRQAELIRFRFPWPDEDDVEPGAFHDPFRGAGLFSLNPPGDLEHGTVQFTAPGYVVSLPCPGAPEGSGLWQTSPCDPKATRVKIHPNGHPGIVRVTQQRLVREGQQLILATICECGGCRRPYRLDTLAEAGVLANACHARAATYENPQGPSAVWWRTVADRILDGYRIAAN